MSPRGRPGGIPRLLAAGLLAVLASCNDNPRGICPAPSRGVGTWEGVRGGALGNSGPVSDGQRVYTWDCGASDCDLTSVESPGQGTAEADYPGAIRRFRATMGAGSGHVLILGGIVSEPWDPIAYPSSALLYSREDTSWVDLPHPDWFLAGRNHEIVWTGDAFLTWGGWRDPGDAGALPHGELEAGALVDPVTGTWRPLTTNGRPDGQGPMIWTSRGLFLWVYSPEQTAPSAWLYSPDDDTWEALPLDPGLTVRYPFLAASDEAVYVVGGERFTYGDPVTGEGYRYATTDTWIREVWEFRLAERTWKRLAVPGDAAVGMHNRFVDGRLYLVDSTCAPGSFYEPATETWGVTTWPEDIGWPVSLLEVGGKLSIYGEASHLSQTGSFFQYTP